MKYCIPYHRDFRYFDLVDEVILNYKEHNDNIIDFITNKFSQEQRIIIDITGKTKEIEEVVPILKKLQQEHKEIVAKIPLYAQDFESEKFNYEYLREADIPFFFAEFCRTEDEVYAF